MLMFFTALAAESGGRMVTNPGGALILMQWATSSGRSEFPATLSDRHVACAIAGIEAARLKAARSGLRSENVGFVGRG